MDDSIKNYTDEQLSEAYDKLPEDTQGAVLSISTEKIIQLISEKHRLTTEKEKDLANETALVMLGLTHPKDYVTNLSSRLDVDMLTARKIGEEVNSKIFSKVKDSLRKIHKIEEAPKPHFTGTAVLTPEGIKEREEKKEDLSPSKEDIMKEIEKEESEISSFEARTKQEVFRAAPKESKEEELANVPKPPSSPSQPSSGYTSNRDPYRESVE